MTLKMICLSTGPPNQRLDRTQQRAGQSRGVRHQETEAARLRRSSETSVLLLLAISVLTSCNQAPPAAQKSAPQPQPELTDEFQTLRRDFFRLQFRVSALESQDASVSTEEQGYGIAKTNFGAFTVSTRAVTPYLDGFKVKLRIGNLTSAAFSGAKISVTWGPPFDEKNPEEYSKNRKTKEFSVTTRFPAGSFTDLEVALTPAKPGEVKTLSVGIQLDQLSLRVP